MHRIGTSRVVATMVAVGSLVSGALLSVGTSKESPTYCQSSVPAEDVECDRDLGHLAYTCADLGFVGGELGCTRECRFDTSACTSCGDGEQQRDEECDLGVRWNSDTLADRCRTDCTAPRCGDGVRDTGEDCDAGTALAETPNSCRPGCVDPWCGDGILDDWLGEQCDCGDSFATLGASCLAPNGHALSSCDATCYAL